MVNVVGQHLGERNGSSVYKNAMATKCEAWACELSRDIVLRT